jgi:citrate lyase beta subunit
MSPKTTLPEGATREVLARLGSANASFIKTYPGETGRRQPVHTVYGGANLFSADSAKKLGGLAVRSLEEFAPDFVTFAQAVGLPGAETLPSSLAAIGDLRAAIEKDPETFRRNNTTAWMAHVVYGRVVAKVKREPVEDFRIDFEDGYGNRPDAEEDGHAEQAAKEVAKGMKAGTLPPFLGIRVKPFTEELHGRSLRTLDIFLSTLVAEVGPKLPDNFVITLPKVQIPEQAAAFADILAALEPKLGLPEGSLQIELMIEVTQAIIDAQGRSTLPLLLAACKGRCRGAHFGTYDYTASCNITAAYQHMEHPVCDFAKHMMQVAYAGTGIMLSDGATTVMPISPHKAKKDGPALTSQQLAENTASVHRAWKLHFKNARHSLENGYYQGWDLHPAQLPTRYAAVYAFFLESLDAASERLKAFIGKAAQATLVGDIFDDAATGQGLLNFFLRGVNCGAITEEEALGTGVTIEELRGRSFLKILQNRRK